MLTLKIDLFPCIVYIDQFNCLENVTTVETADYEIYISDYTGCLQNSTINICLKYLLSDTLGLKDSYMGNVKGILNAKGIQNNSINKMILYNLNMTYTTSILRKALTVRQSRA